MEYPLCLRKMGMIYDLTPLLSRRRAPKSPADDPRVEILSRKRSVRLPALFSLDSISKYSLSSFREYLETPSRNRSVVSAPGLKLETSAENLEKYLHFGGKRNSCRGPPTF